MTLFGQLWHCLNTKMLPEILTFYNSLGLALKPLGDLYVSEVAPLCISPETDSSGKSSFLWSRKVWPDFRRAFRSVHQEVNHNLESVLMRNECNFNRLHFGLYGVKIQEFC